MVGLSLSFSFTFFAFTFATCTLPRRCRAAALPAHAPRFCTHYLPHRLLPLTHAPHPSLPGYIMRSTPRTPPPALTYRTPFTAVTCRVVAAMLPAGATAAYPTPPPYASPVGPRRVLPVPFSAVAGDTRAALFHALPTYRGFAHNTHADGGGTLAPRSCTAHGRAFTVGRGA